MSFNHKLRNSLAILGVAILISEKSFGIAGINGQNMFTHEPRPVDSIIVTYNNYNDKHSGNSAKMQSLTQSIQHNFAYNLQYDSEITDGMVVYKIINQNVSGMSSADAQSYNSNLEKELEKLRKDPNVKYADLNRTLYALSTPNDSRYSEQWHYFESAGGINLPKTWDITTGDSDIIVGVIDSGIVKHSDYDSKILPGRNFHTPSGGPEAYYDQGSFGGRLFHGSHVSGTIAALSDNNLGVSGVSWGAKILPVKVLGGERGEGDMNDILSGMKWAAGLNKNSPNSNQANVLNLSLGGPYPCDQTTQSVIDEITSKGIIIVVAAGNDNAHAANYMPASCNNVVTVGANNRSGFKSDYSNYGVGVIDIAAPGGETKYQNDPNGILSTHYSEQYEYLQGTSMASPHVAGVVALMLSVKPDLTTDQIIKYLQEGARGNIPEFGVGIVDAYNTIKLLQGDDGNGDDGNGDDGNGDDGNGDDGNGDDGDENTAIETTSGVPYNNISGDSGDSKLFYIDVTANNPYLLTVWTLGTLTDPMIRVAYNRVPTAEDNDCDSGNGLTKRNCLMFRPNQGRYYIELYSSSAYSNVSLWSMFY